MAETHHQIPDWEAPAAPPKRGFLNKPAFLSSSASSKTSDPVSKEGESPLVAEEAPVPRRRGLSDRLPPSIARLGRNRKVLLISAAAIVLLILILGLALGLTLNKGKHKSLPLPTGKGTYNGDLTYYSPGPGFGACGYENTSQDAICAVSHLLWDAVSTSSNPNNNPLCGKKLRITRFNPEQERNNSIDVTVVDRCTGCKPTDIDLSIKMFESLADEAQGRVVGTWAWLDYP